MATHRIADARLRRPCLNACVPVLALVFLLGPAAAQAATVINIGTNAFRILDLDVPGFDVPFNVLFDVGSAAEIYENPPAFDFGSQAEAAAAVTAVNTALNLEVDPITTVNPFSSSYYLVPFSRQGSLVFAEAGTVRVSDGSWFRLTQDYEFAQPGSYAVFTPVPEPGTAALLGLGLAGLGVARRSRREESQGAA